MNDMTWNKLGAGTMQCAPERDVMFHIWKVRNIISNGESVITYQVVQLTENDWLHLGAADTFKEAKEIAARAYSQTT